MLTETIRHVLIRELRTVAREVDAYPSDDLLWRRLPGIPNAGGTLALHIAGNLEHYVGAVLGGTGYERDREAEFSTRDLSRSEVLTRVEAAVEAVDASLKKLTMEEVERDYPEQVRGRRIRTADFLVHLTVHLGYHLGQLDYHRRALDPDAEGVGAISLAGLPELTPGESRSA